VKYKGGQRYKTAEPDQTRHDEPAITVDNIEFAQFINLR